MAMVNKRILLIEDDAVLQSVTKKSLVRRGFDVVAFSDFDSAEAHIANFDNPEQPAAELYSAAILDLKLGYQLSLPLITQLKMVLPEIKILVLTGYASIATAVEAVKLGATNYLPKPASIDEMLDALELAAEDNSKNNEGQLAVPEAASDTPIASAQRLEWEYIQRVLMSNQGNISATARQLNMHRRTLQRKLQKHPHRV